MSAPRKIWANVAVESNGAGLCGEWNHCDVGSTEDTIYHHDDVVRELVEALRGIVGIDSTIDATPRGGRQVVYGPFAQIARAALAKIAQEDRG